MTEYSFLKIFLQNGENLSKKITEIMVSEFKSDVFWTEGQRDFTLKSSPYRACLTFRG
jgi:hypothetical protein